MNGNSASSSNAADTSPDHVHVLRRLQVIGLAVICLFVAAGGVWSMTTALRGAVAASGQFVVAGEVKKVQHPQGGVVGELLVREGDKVEQGDTVLRLDDTMARASYQIVVKQLDEFAARTLRLEAERDAHDQMIVPAAFAARRSNPDIDRLLSAEIRLFEIRRSARDGQRQQLRKRITQLQDEIIGLKAQQGAKEREASIIATELVGVEELYRRNLIQLPRLSALQREQASLEGQRGQLIASIAQTTGKIAETELQIIQIDEDQRAEVMKDLREIQAREGELVERRTAAEDQLKRVDVRAPASGIVHQLAVHTVGGVLQQGEPAMLIVPVREALQLEVRVAPSDIDQIAPGQAVRIKIQAGNQSTNPELLGSVLRIGADASRDDKQGFSFYTIRVDVSDEEIARLRPLKVLAGMQAEAFIETVARSPLAFLLKPINTQLDRAFRER
jgi:HlyD family secretion protein